MEKKNVIVSLIIGCAFVIGLSVFGYNVSKLKRPDKRIAVTGMAERNFKSDLAVWTATYEVRAADIQQGYKLMEESKKVVNEFLNAQKITPQMVEYGAIQLEREYNKDNYCDNKTFVGYLLKQSFTVTSKDIDQIDKLSRDVSQVIKDGVEISSQTPNYFYTNLNELKVEMLKEASSDAKKRADVIAEGSGSHVGKLQKADQGVFQIVGLNSNEDYSWGGSFNTSSKEKTASVTIKATYSLK